MAGTQNGRAAQFGLGNVPHQKWLINVGRFGSLVQQITKADEPLSFSKNSLY